MKRLKPWLAVLTLLMAGFCFASCNKDKEATDQNSLKAQLQGGWIYSESFTYEGEKSGGPAGGNFFGICIRDTDIFFGEVSGDKINQYGCGKLGEETEKGYLVKMEDPESIYHNTILSIKDGKLRHELPKNKRYDFYTRHEITGMYEPMTQSQK